MTLAAASSLLALPLLATGMPAAGRSNSTASGQGRSSRGLFELSEWELGSHGIPADYAAAMLALKLPGASYVNSWCEGATTNENCPASVGDFPGKGTTSWNSWAEVQRQGALLPKLQHDGSVWRGNELGFIISNPYFWPEVSPPAVMLGATVDQHMVIRPILESIFGPHASSRWSPAMVSESVQQFLSARATIDVQTDIKAWTHQLLFKVAFDAEVSWTDAVEFVGMQTKLTTYSTLAQLLPAEIAGYNVKDALFDATGASEVRAYLQQLVQSYVPHVEREFGPALAEVGDAACLPTASCALQLASALLDTFAAAGGLSVPSAISTALGVLFSDHATNPAGTEFSQTYSGTGTEPSRLFYESMRVFAPVVGFPWWTTAPTPTHMAGSDCEGAPCANQYQGGERNVLNLALAQRDRAQWGADAETFRLRTHAEYAASFVGFADMAVDSSVAGGKMDRACPGKDLAVQIGSTFFEQFDAGAWQLSPAQGSIEFAQVTPFVDEFTLFAAATPCPFECGGWDVVCKAQEAHCGTCSECEALPSCSSECAGSSWWRRWGCTVSCHASRVQCVVC